MSSKKTTAKKPAPVAKDLKPKKDAKGGARARTDAEQFIK